jgi:hypothetical protein
MKIFDFQVQQLFSKLSFKVTLKLESVSSRNKVLFTLDFGVLACQNRPGIFLSESLVIVGRAHS